MYVFACLPPFGSICTFSIIAIVTSLVLYKPTPEAPVAKSPFSSRDLMRAGLWVLLVNAIFYAVLGFLVWLGVLSVV